MHLRHGDATFDQSFVYSHVDNCVFLFSGLFILLRKGDVVTNVFEMLAQLTMSGSK